MLQNFRENTLVLVFLTEHRAIPVVRRYRDSKEITTGTFVTP
jgi:hypothetical protein